jgi:hypothetical protein
MDGYNENKYFGILTNILAILPKRAVFSMSFWGLNLAECLFIHIFPKQLPDPLSMNAFSHAADGIPV